MIITRGSRDPVTYHAGSFKFILHHSKIRDERESQDFIEARSTRSGEANSIDKASLLPSKNDIDKDSNLIGTSQMSDLYGVIYGGVYFFGMVQKIMQKI